MFYNLGLTIGLTIGDIDNMTAGELLDLCYYRVELTEKRKGEADKGRKAQQADFDSF